MVPFYFYTARIRDLLMFDGQHISSIYLFRLTVTQRDIVYICARLWYIFENMNLISFFLSFFPPFF